LAPRVFTAPERTNDESVRLDTAPVAALVSTQGSMARK